MNRNDDKYLAHYGILGMKWGVRRYQNPDGSMTAAGKRRYGGGKPVFKSTAKSPSARKKTSTQTVKTTKSDKQVKKDKKQTLKKMKNDYEIGKKYGKSKDGLQKSGDFMKTALDGVDTSKIVNKFMKYGLVGSALEQAVYMELAEEMTKKLNKNPVYSSDGNFRMSSVGVRVVYDTSYIEPIWEPVSSRGSVKHSDSEEVSNTKILYRVTKEGKLKVVEINDTEENSGELKHYGILGMKWGVRRYQNPDGSLTTAGKRRRAKNEAATLKKQEKKLSRSEKKIAAIQKDIDNLKSNRNKMLALKSIRGKPLFVEKDIDEMISGLEANKLKETRLEEQRMKKKESDTLRKEEKNRRKELVRNRSILPNKELDDLANRINRENQLLKSSKSEGQNFTEQVISTSGNRILTTVITGAGIYAVRSALQNKFDPKEAAEYLKPKKK